MKKTAIITCGLSFGDEGKGTVVDYLTHKLNAKLCVRYNGGAQAAHHVYLKDGKNFCFKQMSSGSLAGASTLLTDGVVINPMTLLMEMSDFWHKFKFVPKIYIHENCLVTTQSHVIQNRIEEAKNNHGSCGMGVWKTVCYHEQYGGIQAKHLQSSDLMDRLKVVRDNIKKDVGSCWEMHKDSFSDEELEAFVFLMDRKNQMWLNYIIIVDVKQCLELLNHSSVVVFEGAQGVMLDKDLGTIPHVSATTTTNRLAYQFLSRIQYEGERIAIGITRCYNTRHGNGPLPFESDSYAIISDSLVGEDNVYNKYQGHFRVAHLDYSSLRYAMAHSPVDYIFVTCLDNNPFLNILESEKLIDRLQLAETIASRLNTKLYGISVGKNRENKFSLKEMQKS